MFSIKMDMNTRVNESKEVIDFIRAIELSDDFDAPRPNTMVLKSSVVIMLYNVVESTVSRVLYKIHEVIISEDVKYYELSKSIRNLMIIYFHKNREKNPDIHNSIDVIHSTIDFINGINGFNLNYTEMAKFYSLYSGNLDARQVRKVFQKYEISISDNIGECLKNIKTGRNKLAHGEISFEEYGRDIVINVLDSYISDVHVFLSSVISSTEIFLNEKKYKSPI
ncbi:MAE_28990/MAE_18760 family HEPN-like nuclease [Serratia fonticola]